MLPETRARRKNAVGGQPSPFADPRRRSTRSAILYPGEAGIRNLLRGDGYFAIDASIGKGFKLPSTQRLEFRWDIFNVTNTPKFDTGDVTMFPDIARRASAATTARWRPATAPPGAACS